MKPKKDITGIILAGGKSSRMGTAKGFLALNNKLFIQYSIDALKPLVSEIIIVSNDSKYDALGFRRINDIAENFGPVAGVYSGLEASSSNFNLILSCDIPLITTKILERLIEAIDEDSEIIQIEVDKKTMPLIALYKKHTKDVFYALLQKNEHRLRMAVNTCKVKQVILDKTEHLFTTNINTKEEFKRIKHANNY